MRTDDVNHLSPLSTTATLAGSPDGLSDAQQQTFDFRPAPAGDNLDKVRAAVEAIKKVDLSAFTPNQDLGLDSINRISLIAELELAFDLEIDSESITPEVFASLASLTEWIETMKS